MNKNELAIATMTWARNEAEETLLSESLEYLSGLGITIYLADGGSGTRFISFLHSLPNVTVVKTKGQGLWSQVQCSLMAARLGRKPFVLYTEPDKGGFFKNYLEDLIHTTPVLNRTGIVLASRTSKAFATFPKFQQTTETSINFACAEVTGKAYDYTYGPFIMNGAIIPYLNDMPPHLHWGWRPYAFCIAYRLGYTVTEWKDDFECPPDQQSDNPEERIYRLKQLHQNIEGVVLAASAKLT